MKVVAHLTFNFAIIVALSVALYFSQDWPKETALFPQAIGLPILALSIISFGLVLYRARRGIEEPGESGETGFSDVNFVKKSGVILGWLLGFALAIWILGFFLAALFFVFFYMRIQGKMTWVTCFSYSSGYMIIVYVLFDVILHVEMYTGMVWGFLGI